MPPATAASPATPSPPVASEQPPNHTAVAFVASTPLRDEIPVPVDAVASNVALP